MFGTYIKADYFKTLTEKLLPLYDTYSPHMQAVTMYEY